MRIYAAYSPHIWGKMPHILPHFWLASFPHIFQKKSCYKPVSLIRSRRHLGLLLALVQKQWEMGFRLFKRVFYSDSVIANEFIHGHSVARVPVKLVGKTKYGYLWIYWVCCDISKPSGWTLPTQVTEMRSVRNDDVFSGQKCYRYIVYDKWQMCHWTVLQCDTCVQCNLVHCSVLIFSSDWRSCFLLCPWHHVINKNFHIVNIKKVLSSNNLIYLTTYFYVLNFSPVHSRRACGNGFWHMTEVRSSKLIYSSVQYIMVVC